MPKPFLTIACIALFCFVVAARGENPPAASGIELSDCRINAGPGFPGIKARCGVFQRHLDPFDTTSAVLELSVAVVPALSLKPEPDAFVPIAGGPGAASTGFYAGYVRAFEKIRRNRDILLVDQRGTGKSAPLTCDYGDEIFEGQLSMDESIAFTESCLDALPYDPRFFTTSVAVRDLEAVRQALGYPTLNLYGVSYGSRVAQHYARRYPEQTRSVILDGVVPPKLALGPGIAIEAEKALQSILHRCEEDVDCGRVFPNISKDFQRLEAKLSQQPISVSLSHPVSGEQKTLLFGEMEFAGAIRLMNYSPYGVALMPLLIHEAVNGNYAPLAATFLQVAEDLSGQLATGMHNAVVCTEDTPYYEGIDNEALRATYIGPVMTETLEAMCSVWPAGLMDDDLRTPLNTDTPVLLLSGSADPITPPRFAELAAVDLSNARLLIGANQGHGQASQGCFPDIIGRFVASASVDGLDEACLERLFTMPFFLNFSGPAP